MPKTISMSHYIPSLVFRMQQLNISSTIPFQVFVIVDYLSLFIDFLLENLHSHSHVSLKHECHLFIFFKKNLMRRLQEFKWWSLWNISDGSMYVCECRMRFRSIGF